MSIVLQQAKRAGAKIIRIAIYIALNILAKVWCLIHSTPICLIASIDRHNALQQNEPQHCYENLLKMGLKLRKQQEIWETEHAQSASLPSLADHKPHSGVIDFVKFLARLGIDPPRKIVDIGCGKGRNAIYLAKQGFEVYGMDYSNHAIHTAKLASEREQVSELIHWSHQELDKPWPFNNDYFDLALDCFSSIDIETAEGRKYYNQEMFRTLKCGGYSLVTVVSAHDTIEKEMILNSPGQEINSTYWTNTGKFQKNYDENELREFYSSFEIIELKEIKKISFKLGRQYEATNFWLLLQKP